MSSFPSIVAVSTGNTRTAIALFNAEGLARVARVANADLAGIVAEILACVEQGGGAVPVILATVNETVGDALRQKLEQEGDLDLGTIGRDLEAPIGRQLDPESIIGVDRLLNAAAAFDQIKQACVVIDAGTAITVDFVDGEGTFHGGAILPGAQMQLNALHEQTDQLPEIDFVAPDDEPFGANTHQAMLQGVFYGIRGAVRHLIERYAEAFEAYPAIVVTGGDAHVIFDNDELMENVVDDLTLHGMAIAVRMARDGVPDDA